MKTILESVGDYEAAAYEELNTSVSNKSYDLLVNSFGEAQIRTENGYIFGYDPDTMDGSCFVSKSPYNTILPPVWVKDDYLRKVIRAEILPRLVKMEYDYKLNLCSSWDDED